MATHFIHKEAIGVKSVDIFNGNTYYGHLVRKSRMRIIPSVMLIERFQEIAHKSWKTMESAIEYINTLIEKEINNA